MHLINVSFKEKANGRLYSRHLVHITISTKFEFEW